MIYFQIKDLSSGVLIAENIKEFSGYFDLLQKKESPFRNKSIKSAVKTIGEFEIWVVVENEPDFLKSSKRFKLIFRTLYNLARILFVQYNDKINAHSHSLREIQGQMKQKVDGFAPQKKFRGENYNEEKNNIMNVLQGNIEAGADLVCYLNKRIFEIEAHIEIFDLIYEDYNKKNKSINKPLIFKRVNIKKVVQNIIAPFRHDMDSLGIKIVFHE
jgi:hypothetical protein